MQKQGEPIGHLLTRAWA